MSVIIVRLLLVASLVLVGSSAFLSESAFLGTLALGFTLLSSGLALGPRLAPSYRLWPRTLVGAAAFTAAVSLAGCGVYYLATVSSGLLFAVVALALAAAFALAKEQKFPAFNLSSQPEEVVLFLSGLTALCAWWYQVFAHNDTLNTTAVRTVWSIFDPHYLVLLAVALSCALFLAWRKSATALPLLAVTLFAILSLAALVYPLGFGFDPFIHRATVQHIAEFGTITPKPLYYIGQYVLELMAIKIFHFNLAVFDALLVPAFVALVVPAVTAGYRHTWSLAALVFLPFAAFVQTTPMALALMWSTVCLLLPRRPLVAPALFALTALFTHPLAGIPAVMYIVLLFIEDKVQVSTTKNILIALTTVAASVAIPLAFVVQAAQAGLKVNIAWHNLLRFDELPLSAFFGTRFSAFGDLAYTFIQNHFLFIIILTALAIFVSRANWKTYRPALLVALSMIISFLILSLAFDFRYLISYERTDFALRLLAIASLFTLPLLADSALLLKDKIRFSPALITGLICLLALAGTSYAYGAYPRHDNYARSAGFNVTEIDISTVHAINDMAADQAYAVLSDQALSAAAVKEFGFAKYYPGDIFYYPIPTGGPLYAIYLDLVENGPTQEKIKRAMELTGTDLIFFAVHDYWWQSPGIIENSKALADDWFTLGDPATNAVTVFVFKK